MAAKNNKGFEHDVMEGINGGGKKTLLRNVLGAEKNSRDQERNSRTNFREIALQDITPRPVNRFRQVGIERLARSIKATTLINPIVVVPPSYLPEDSEVLKRFRETGIDPSALKYVIVSGERRFRAVKMLHEEELRDWSGSRLGDYKYAKINARVLTKEEARNEELIYADSNIETRQLSSLELMINCREMMSSVETPEEKQQALLDMGLNPETDRFNQVKYCKYYFENELGIMDVTESNLKQTLATVQQCSAKVLDAIVDGVLTMRKARELRELSEEQQEKLILLLQEGKADEYEFLLEKLTSKGSKDKKTERFTHRDAAKILLKNIDYFEKSRKQLEFVLKNLSGDDEKVVSETVSEIEELIGQWKEKYQKLK